MFDDPYDNDIGPDPNCNSEQPRLETVLRQFDVSAVEAKDLLLLEDFEIACICDDSGSMRRPAVPVRERTLGKASLTRWQAMKETLSLMIEIGNCFDASGIDIFFLNRSDITRVKSPHDSMFRNAFMQDPRGGTPLTETLRRVAHKFDQERPVLLFILTDGEPTGSLMNFDELCQIDHATPRFAFRLWLALLKLIVLLGSTMWTLLSPMLKSQTTTIPSATRS